MLKMISRFAASPFSGYALIALVIAGAGAGYWFWTELKEFGSLEVQNEVQAQAIQTQTEQIAALAAQMESRQEVNTNLTNQIAILQRTFSAVRQRIKNAESKASKALTECLDMHVADGMRFGTSTDTGTDQDKAKPSVDG